MNTSARFTAPFTHAPKCLLKTFTMSFLKIFVFCIFIANVTSTSAQTGIFVQPDVKCGIENLVDTNFELLKGKNVALLTNQAGRLKNLTSSLDAFKNTDQCFLKAVLVPEHGYNGSVPAGEKVESFLDSSSMIPVYSLYGTNRRPLRAMLQDCDVVVVDLQDIGVR
ncbi:MAG TPA: exo-beta-N-acetylmuramidase NamZ domain-containing protein, partial [Patescibacteria group bacterium]|nr:exo-beta-N-acetylmuramidase NamZ domain-containing protein [Patescibacteria group bacterium]